MPFCTHDGLKLYYEVHGNGPHLLLISGLSGGTWSWCGQVPFFSSHYRTIIFDNRGAGQSDMPEGPYNLSQLAQDALCVLNAVTSGEAFVMGLSMGGMIAQEFALKAPDRVRALLLGCTHCGGSLRIPPQPETIRTLVDNTGLSHEQIVDKNMPLFLSEACLRDRPDLVDDYRKAQLSVPLQPEYAFHAQLEAISRFDVSLRISQIQAPTLIVSGIKDRLIPHENALLLADLIPGAQLVDIPEAGHAIHVECRDRLNTLAHGFFQQVLENRNRSNLP